MADNKLNLVVRFTALDGLSGALKGMIGLGRSSSSEMKSLGRELNRVSREVKDYDARIRNTSGSVNHLWDAQKKLMAQEDQLRAKLEQRKKLMAIDGRTARVQAQADRYRQEGQSGLMWGAAMAYPAYEMAKSAGEFEAMRNRLHILGLNDRTVDHLTAYSQAMNIAGSSAKENLRYLLEAQGAFRESGEHNMEEQLRGAKIMAPLMAKMAATLRASGKALDEEQERYFLRFIEQAGGTTDPRRAASLTDGLFRAIQSSGGTVDAAAYQGFLARAGTAGMKLSTRSMFADFEPLIAELHDAAGVGLQTAYSRVNGMVKNQAAAREMIRLGLWDRDKIIFNQVGGIKEFKRGENPLRADAANSMASDPIEFYRKYVLPAYQQNGVKDVQRENMMLFGRTGGALFNLIDKQLPVILRSREAYARTQSLDRAYTQTKDGFFGEGGQMRAAWQDFMITAGTKGGLLENMTGALRMATGALRALTGAANAHPTAFRWIATAVTALIGMRLATAAAKFAFGGMLGPVGRLWGLWSRYRALGSVAAMFPRFARGMDLVRGAAILMGTGIGRGARFAVTGFSLLARAALWLNGSVVAGFLRVMPMMARGFGLARTAVLLLGQGVLRAGLMMLGNPIVLIIAAIVAALAGAAYLIYTHWDTIKGAFWRGVAWVKESLVALPSWLKGLGSMAMQGLLMAFSPTALSARLVQIAKTGVTAFKNYFGIKSPSRLMIAMGGHINDGLAIGVNRTGNRPMQAVARMAAAVAGAGAVTLPAPVMAQSRIAPIPRPNPTQGFGTAAMAGRLSPIVAAQSRPAPVAMQTPAVVLQGRPMPVAMRAPAVVLQSRPAPVAMRAPAVVLQSRPAPVAMRAPAVIAQSRIAPFKASAPRLDAVDRRIMPKAFTPPVNAERRFAAAKAIRLAPVASARPNRAAPPPAKIEIHIHQQPGENADALTRRIMDALKREQRKGRLSQHADDF